MRDNKEVARAITKDPEIMHGTPVFRGTRVPLQTLFDYLEGNIEKMWTADFPAEEMAVV